MPCCNCRREACVWGWLLDKVNEAIDKGWRLREAGPPGVSVKRTARRLTGANMIDKVNEAIDKGWRLREAGPPGVWVLIDPETVDKDLGFLTKGFNVLQLYIPTEELTAWLEARIVHTPDEKLRNSKYAAVKAFFHASWDGYVVDCGNDPEYARDIILADATNDFEMPEDKDLVAKWLKEVIAARKKS